MIIEVDGSTYNIVIQSSSKAIAIGAYKNQMIHLHVPYTVPTAELYAYIRANSRLIKNYITQINSEKEISSFQIFDTTFPLVIKSQIPIPYLYQDRIYASAYPTHKKAIDNLQLSLLLQQLTLQISAWEEHLDILLFEIKTRKLKTNYFTICTRNKRITFSSDLIQKSIGFISFICGEAVMCLAHTDAQERPRLLDKFVKDWKQYKKIVSYEREYTD
ncbi:M48 family metallopeptidase [Sphingobacterium olei]|uniref:M48 family metallopeptidase n=1 Tax=Sphingobacterium olei TaxID=2571155 RepID=A0A4U0P7U2_9SPHI|nr:YgjP-like metallopeptidase domain-containing protein [Sphingobacterium olei]TJZ63430.1 M48 family metallopeptidase [Sphingobacterium olei]